MLWLRIRANHRSLPDNQVSHVHGMPVPANAVHAVLMLSNSLATKNPAAAGFFVLLITSHCGQAGTGSCCSTPFSGSAGFAGAADLACFLRSSSRFCSSFICAARRAHS